MLDSDLQSKLRKIQTKVINRTKKSYSLSRCLNDVLRDGW